jgi:hypothetical protein
VRPGRGPRDAGRAEGELGGAFVSMIFVVQGHAYHGRPVPSGQCASGESPTSSIDPLDMCRYRIGIWVGFLPD